VETEGLEEGKAARGETMESEGTVAGLRVGCLGRQEYLEG
jgi:hypothetical protein